MSPGRAVSILCWHRSCPTSSTQVTLFAEHGRHDFAGSGMIRTERRGAWHWLGCAPKVNPARQIAACPEHGLGLWCGRSSMGGCEWLGLRSASGAKSERCVRCSTTPDPPGGSGRSGSSRRESVPTDPRRSACFWQSVQESPTPPKNGRCVRVRARRRPPSRNIPLMGWAGRAPAPPAGEVLLQRTAVSECFRVCPRKRSSDVRAPEYAP